MDSNLSEDKEIKNVLLVFGTRPEAIKMAPVYSALKKYPCLNPLVCLTGQHQEMLEQVIKVFDIEVSHNLNVMDPDASLPEISALILTRLSKIIREIKPDIVLVHGDTLSAASAAQCSFLMGVKVAHVEAGLRSGDLMSPWPEEANRKLISVVSDLNFAPTELAKQNLVNEGHPLESIFVTGNTVVDALYETTTRLKEPKLRSEIIESLGLLLDCDSDNYVLVTGHRRENFSGGLLRVCLALQQLAQQFTEWHFVYPVHLNPNVRDVVFDQLDSLPNIHLIDPLGYLQFVYLMENCQFIITDSGGIQEEAPSLGIPVLVTRDTTERPEGLVTGCIELVGTDIDLLLSKASALIEKSESGSFTSSIDNPYGDGDAAHRIAKIISQIDF